MALQALKKTDHPAASRGVLVHKGTRYAVGLTWLAADEDGDFTLVRERAKKLEADFYCIRSTVVTQNGFGYLAMGHRTGLPAAASLAADTLVGEWHGVFAADNGWWYIAVHADAIAPDGDIFFEAEEDAYNFFLERSGDYNWPRVYAPEAWNVEGSSGEIPLTTLLEDSTRAATLRPRTLNALFGGPYGKSIALLIGLMLVGFLVSVLVTPLFFSTGTRTEQVRSAAYDIKAPPPEPASAASADKDLSYMRMPRPSAALRLCEEGFSRLTIPLPGWEFTGISCDMNGSKVKVEVLWRKGSGSLELAKAHIGSLPSDAAVDFNGVDIIKARMDVGNLNEVSEAANVITRNDAIRILSERFGEIGRLEIRDKVPPPPPERKGIDAMTQPPPPPQLPPYLEIKVTTETPPNILASYFDVPGLKLQNINWASRKRAWVYDCQLFFDSELLRQNYGQ